MYVMTPVIGGCHISVCDVGQCCVTGGPGNDHRGDDVRRGFFEWITRRYGFLNGLQVDMGLG